MIEILMGTTSEQDGLGTSSQTHGLTGSPGLWGTWRRHCLATLVGTAVFTTGFLAMVAGFAGFPPLAIVGAGLFPFGAWTVARLSLQRYPMVTALGAMGAAIVTSVLVRQFVGISKGDRLIVLAAIVFWSIALTYHHAAQLLIRTALVVAFTWAAVMFADRADSNVTLVLTVGAPVTLLICEGLLLIGVTSPPIRERGE